MVKCVNCGCESDGKYCHECGEKMLFKRMNVRTVFYDKLYDITHWEDTVLYTIKQLILMPGITVRNYIHGIKKNIVKPLRYFLSVTSIHIIIFRWLSIRFFEYYTTTNGNFTGEEMITEKEQFALMNANLNYFEFLLPVFFSFFFYLLYRKKHGINYAESLTAAFYWTGTMMGLAIIALLLSIIDVRFWYLGTVIDVAYILYASLQFNGSYKFPDIIRSIVFTGLSYAAFIIITGLFSELYVEYIKKH